MREYETIYVLRPDLPADVSKDIQDKIDTIIQKHEGVLLVRSDWGKRKLAYPIDKLSQAQYFYFQYLAMGPLVDELERNLKYDDRVLRFLTVKLNDVVDVQARTAATVEAPEVPPEFGADHGARDTSSRYYGSESRSYGAGSSDFGPTGNHQEV